MTSAAQERSAGGNGAGPSKTALAAAVVAASYFLFAKIGLLFLVRPDGFSAFWPAAGILPAVLPILRKRDRGPAVAAVFATLSIANVTAGMSPGVAAAYATVHCVESVAAAWALFRITGGKVGTLGAGDFFRFLFTCVLAICGLSSIVGAAAGVFLGGSPSFLSAGFLWWAANATGMMLITPLILSLAPAIRSGETIPKDRFAELTVLAVALSVATAVVFGRSPEQPVDALSMVIRPWALLVPMMWAALRAQPRFVLFCSLLLWSIAIFFTSRGFGPYRVPGIPIEAAFATLFAFLIVSSVFSYVTASLLREAVEGRRTVEETRARFAGLFQESRAVMLVIDPESGRIVAANPAASDFYGYPEEKLASMNIAELNTLPPEMIRESLDRASHGKGLFFQFRHKLADGSVRDVEVYSGPSRRKGKTYLFSIVHDVTERIRAERERRILERRLELAQKRESLGTMAGGIAHQFNNLLTGVLGYIELAKESLPPSSAAGRHLNEAEASARRAAEFSRSMLVYVGQGVRRKAVREIGRMVEELLPLIRTALPGNVRLEVDAPPGGPSVNMDPSDFQQVLSTLFTNAWEAMGEKEGVVRISVRPAPDAGSIPGFNFAVDSSWAGPWACLEVSDTGAGMDGKTMDRIFDPFFSTKFTGRGLGLPVTQGIVRHYGGTIFVDSGPGRGTRFSVLFPASEAASLAEEATAAPFAVGDPTGTATARAHPARS